MNDDTKEALQNLALEALNEMRSATRADINGDTAMADHHLGQVDAAVAHGIHLLDQALAADRDLKVKVKTDIPACPVCHHPAHGAMPCHYTGGFSRCVCNGGTPV